MKKVIVLGSGLIGKVMAADLSTEYDVTVADINKKSLDVLQADLKVATTVCDFSDNAELMKVIAPFELVIGAVPGFMGFETLRTIIESGKNVADISFFPEDALKLDSLAKKHGVTAIVDCGVAPGMCNMIAGYHHARMKMSRYECLVGGLPQHPQWPFNYKAVFSPIDVIEEYTRPARFVENGKLVVREALSDIVQEEFDGIGILESFNSDGLRSLIETLQGVPDMKEKTLRFPGHTQLMHIFRKTGFFNQEKINVKGVDIAPLDVTTRLLFPLWKMNEGDEDFTIMRVTIEGEENGKHKKYIYTLYDKFDKAYKITSMARTTGYTCTAAANLILQEKFTGHGVFPPELIGNNEECFAFVINYLKKRNVNYHKQELN